MNCYQFTWTRTVKMDCTVFPNAENEQEAREKFSNGEYSTNHHREVEEAELESSDILVTEIKGGE